MNEAERRVIIEVIDNLQEVGEIMNSPYLTIQTIARLMYLLGVGPEYQEDGE